MWNSSTAGEVAFAHAMTAREEAQRQEKRIAELERQLASLILALQQAGILTPPAAPPVDPYQQRYLQRLLEDRNK